MVRPGRIPRDENCRAQFVVTKLGVGDTDRKGPADTDAQLFLLSARKAAEQGERRSLSFQDPPWRLHLPPSSTLSEHYRLCLEPPEGSSGDTLNTVAQDSALRILLNAEVTWLMCSHQ